MDNPAVCSSCIKFVAAEKNALYFTGRTKSLSKEDCVYHSNPNEQSKYEGELCKWELTQKGRASQPDLDIYVVIVMCV